MSPQWPDETVADADWLHLTEDEDVRWTGRPSQYTIAVPVVGGMILVLLGAGLAAWLLPAAEAAEVPRWLGAAPLVLALVGAVWAGLAYLEWLRLLYVLTDQSIYVKYGLVSRDVTHVRLDRVQNTAYEQSILERLLQYGDVHVYTAGTSTEDVTFRSVPNPARVKRDLTQLLSERAETARPHAGVPDD